LLRLHFVARPTRDALRPESNGDASACRGILARKPLFGNKIANPPIGQRHAPRCAMTSSMVDVTEVTGPPPDAALTISSPMLRNVNL
jgi:hypothetical protein